MKTRLLRKLHRAAVWKVRDKVHLLTVECGRLVRLSYATDARALFDGAIGMDATWDNVGHKLSRIVARNLWKSEWRAKWLAKGYGARRRNELCKSVECYVFGPMPTDFAE